MLSMWSCISPFPVCERSFKQITSWQWNKHAARRGKSWLKIYWKYMQGHGMWGNPSKWFDFLCSLDVVIFYTRGGKMWKPCQCIQMDKTMRPTKYASEPTDMTWVQDTRHPSLHKSCRKRQKCERKRLSNVQLVAQWRNVHGVSARLFRDIPSIRYVFPIFPTWWYT